MNQDEIRKMFIAAEYGRTETVAALLDSGVADVNERWVGKTLLMRAAEGGRTETVRLLLDRDADVNTANDEGGTALMYAAARGHTETAALLLDHGADVGAMDNEGGTALLVATKCGHTETAHLLRAAQEARDLAAALPTAHDDPMNRPARRPSGAREPEQASPSRRPRL